MDSANTLPVNRKLNFDDLSEDEEHEAFMEKVLEPESILPSTGGPCTICLQRYIAGEDILVEEIYSKHLTKGFVDYRPMIRLTIWFHGRFHPEVYTLPSHWQYKIVAHSGYKELFIYQTIEVLQYKVLYKEYTNDVIDTKSSCLILQYQVKTMLDHTARFETPLNDHCKFISIK